MSRPRPLRGEAGASMVLMLLIAMGLIAALAPVLVDYGSLFFARRISQNASDAGALAGAETIRRQMDTSLNGNPLGTNRGGTVRGGRYLRDQPVHDCWCDAYAGDPPVCVHCAEPREENWQLLNRYGQELSRAEGLAAQAAREYLEKNRVNGPLRPVAAWQGPDVRTDRWWGEVRIGAEQFPGFVLQGVYQPPALRSGAKARAEPKPGSDPRPMGLQPCVNFGDMCRLIPGFDPAWWEGLESEWRVGLVRDE